MISLIAGSGLSFPRTDKSTPTHPCASRFQNYVAVASSLVFSLFVYSFGKERKIAIIILADLLYPEVSNYNDNNNHHRRSRLLWLLATIFMMFPKAVVLPELITSSATVRSSCPCHCLSQFHMGSSFILEATLSLGSKSWVCRLGQPLLCCVSLARIIRVFEKNFSHHAMGIGT